MNVRKGCGKLALSMVRGIVRHRDMSKVQFDVGMIVLGSTPRWLWFIVVGHICEPETTKYNECIVIKFDGTIVRTPNVLQSSERIVK